MAWSSDASHWTNSPSVSDKNLKQYEDQSARATQHTSTTTKIPVAKGSSHLACVEDVPLVEFMYLVFTEDVPLVEFMYLVFTEDVPLVEFMYLVFTEDVPLVEFMYLVFTEDVPLVEFMYLVFTEDVPLVEFMYLVFTEDVPLVEFMYLVFRRMPGESYRRRLMSLLLYLCYVFRALINSLVG